MLRGTPETRRFYDEVGWVRQAGRTTNDLLFGAREEGPIREKAHEARFGRVRQELRQAPSPRKLLEAGCGANPERRLFDLCSHYTGVDFSTTGLADAARQLAEANVPHELIEADVCDLPFDDGAFNAAYSAHVLYHIADSEAQAAAFREICRVVKPGGVAVFILANPRPLLFWGRRLKRLIADTPGLRNVANAVRRSPPLPYRPMSQGWMRRQVMPFGHVTITCYSLASTWFCHRVSGHSRLGRQAWKLLSAIERRWFKSAARLGCYVQITVHR